MSAPRCGGLGPTCRNPFRSIIVRAVELVHALDEAIRLIDDWAGGPVAWVPVPARAGEGIGATEAPRGLLFHRYRIDDAGSSSTCRSSRRRRRTSRRSRPTCGRRAGRPGPVDDELTRQCEHAIRNYDPCISCATHFLDLRVEHR